MPDKQEVLATLKKLDGAKATALEGQRIEFKEWIPKSANDSVRLVTDACICMANGGGGVVVVGVKDKVLGRKGAIVGVPANVDVGKLRNGIHRGAEPRLNVTLEELAVPEGTGRLILVHVHPGKPPYMDTSGKGSIRVDDACEPLTPAIIQRMLDRTGEADFTAGEIDGATAHLISPAAMERLRKQAASESAASDLLHQSDEELLKSLGLMRNGRHTRAGILLAGQSKALAAHLPGYAWTYLRMKNDTDYDERADGQECLILAIDRVIDVITNPIQTLKQQLIHSEIRMYPVIALREALMNAFGHADYRISAPIQIKQYGNRLEISNPGGFAGGVAPDNILQHASVTRNPTLIAALLPLRLVNRAKVGVRRMFKAMLAEGKEPPEVFDDGDAVRIALKAGELSEAFCKFVEDAAANDQWLEVEHLLVIRRAHEEGGVDLATAAAITQQTDARARDTIRKLEKWGMFQADGVQWRLAADVDYRLNDAGAALAKQQRVEAAVKLITAELRKRKATGMTIADMVSATGLNRDQVRHVTRRLRSLGVAEPSGRGRFSKWVTTANG
ncbi:MAG: ATP-binding protein [Hyphomonadaceae bacterium]|nr:ATP-binding protein [Hyphomonadaceae bacterium]